MINNKRKLVVGVGINDWEVATWDNSIKRDIPEYLLWKSMLTRSYSVSYQDKYPTYKGVSVDSNWLSMTNFIADVSLKVGYRKALFDNWVLDKDLLSDGKLYSNETCCFLPPEINGFLTHKKSINNDNPVGVSFHKITSKYKSEIRFNGKHYYLGLFSDKLEAFEKYKETKETFSKVLAESWKNEIDPRAYNALMNFKVSPY